MRKIKITPFDYCGKQYGLLPHLVGFFLGAAAGFAVSQILFGVIAVNMILAAAFGLVGSRVYVKHLIDRRKRQFEAEVCDYLDAVGGSLSCGKNTYDAFISANEDMKDLYKPDSPICVESAKLSDGLKSGRNINELLNDMAERSGNEDIRIFGQVYSICNYAGGNLKKIISETKTIITEKAETETEIQTALAEPKNELNIMSVMPLVITASLRTLGNSFTGENSVAVNTAALIIFVFAYFWGRKIVNIQV